MEVGCNYLTSFNIGKTMWESRASPHVGSRWGDSAKGVAKLVSP